MPSRLDRVTDWRKAARNARYSVSKMANSVGVSERQLERHFPHLLGQSPKKWVDALRMADSWRLLRRGLMVKEVAARVGFKHVQDFTHAFERVYGVRPSSCRAQGFRLLNSAV